MEKLDSVDEILDFAIKEEEEAFDFYNDLAGKMKKPGMKELFEGFALEEKSHKAKLLAVKDGKLLMPSADKVADLKIADYLVDVTASDDVDYQQALIIAMKKEKAAFRMYTDLAAAAEQGLANTFLALAQEEAKHKLRLEIEYDDEVLAEN